MVTSEKIRDGAVESCATPQVNQDLATRCGPNGPLDSQREISSPPAPSPERRAELLVMAAATRAKIRNHPKLAEPIKRAASGLRKMAAGRATARNVRDTHREIECLAFVFKTIEAEQNAQPQFASH